MPPSMLAPTRDLVTWRPAACGPTAGRSNCVPIYLTPVGLPPFFVGTALGRHGCPQSSVSPIVERSLTWRGLHRTDATLTMYASPRSGPGRPQLCDSGDIDSRMQSCADAIAPLQACPFLCNTDPSCRISC